MQIERKYLSVVEAEALTGISRSSWRKHAYSGRVASSKVGTRLLLPVESVIGFVEDGMRPRHTEEARVAA
jgi:hypothetical protein